MFKKITTLLLGIAIGAVVSYGATVSGVITDSATTDKLSDVAVALRLGNQTVQRDTTGEDGAYSFADVDSGNYTIRATKTGYTVKSVVDTITAEDTLSTVDIAIVKTVTTTVSGVVTDSGSTTVLAGAVVQLRAGTGMGGGTTDTADAEGKFSFANVASGSYTLQVSFTGYTSKSITVTISSAEPQSVDAQLVKTVLTAISGKITDSTSAAALANVAVALRLGNQTVQRDTTGADGAYSFGDVATGEYTVRATLSGYTQKQVTVDAPTADAVTANIAMVKEVTSSVSGTVNDSAAAKPLEGAVVMLRAGTRTLYDTTAEDGKFSFEDVPAGSFTVRASLTGFVTKTVTDSITDAEEPATVTIALATVVTKDITVVVKKTSDSSVVASATVVVASSGTGTAVQRIEVTGTNGKAVFEDVVQGTYSVSGSAAGMTAASASFTLSATSADSVVVYLAAAANGTKTVTGTVSDSTTKKALSGVIVSVRIGGGGGGGATATTIAATTGEDGTYTLAGIPVSSATVTITASLSGYRAFTANRVASGAADTADTTTYNFTMLASGSGVISQQATMAMKRQPSIVTRAGILSFVNFPEAAQVRIFDLSGTVVYSGTLPTLSRGAASIDIGTKLSGAHYVVSVKQGNKELFNRQITLMK